MTRIATTTVLLVLLLAALASPAGAQGPPSLPSLSPGMPLPPAIVLPSGWGYDQASGQFRPPAGMPPTAVVQSFPSLVPGMPLPPYVRLPQGWSYDQPTGHFRHAGALATPSQPATAAPAPPVSGARACNDATAQTAALERNAQVLGTQVQEMQARLQQLQAQVAASQRQRDQVCGLPGGTAAAPPPAPVPAPASAPTPAPWPPGKTTHVPVTALGPIFNALVQGAQLRLNNYQTQDSWLQLGPPLGNARVAIQVAPQAFQFQIGPYATTGHYYLNDLRSTSIVGDAQPGNFLLSIVFASTPTQIVIDPVMGMAPPQVTLTNLRVSAAMPYALDAQARPSYGPMSATVQGDVTCGTLTQVCVSIAPFVKGYIQAQVSQALNDAFGTPDMRSRVGAAMLGAIDSQRGRQTIQQAANVTYGKIAATRYESGALAILSE